MTAMVTHVTRLVVCRLGRVSGGILLGLSCAGNPAPESTEIEPSALVLDACTLPELNEHALCGELDVFEDRGAGVGRRIRLRLAVPAASGPAAQPDPIFVLVGGPGQSAVDNAASYARLLAPLHAERDLVFVDQRGTGGSNPLQCDLYASQPSGPLGDFFPPDAVRMCRADLEQRAELRLYTSVQAAEDLDDVRAALGYERINLEAASYGTRVALLYLRAHSDRVRAAVLRSASPPASARRRSFATTRRPPLTPSPPPAALTRRVRRRSRDSKRKRVSPRSARGGRRHGGSRGRWREGSQRELDARRIRREGAVPALRARVVHVPPRPDPPRGGGRPRAVHGDRVGPGRADRDRGSERDVPVRHVRGGRPADHARGGGESVDGDVPPAAGASGSRRRPARSGRRGRSHRTSPSRSSPTFRSFSSHRRSTRSRLRAGRRKPPAACRTAGTSSRRTSDTAPRRNA